MDSVLHINGTHQQRSDEIIISKKINQREILSFLVLAHICLYKTWLCCRFEVRAIIGRIIDRKRRGISGCLEGRRTGGSCDVTEVTTAVTSRNTSAIKRYTSAVTYTMRLKTFKLNCKTGNVNNQTLHLHLT